MLVTTEQHCRAASLQIIAHCVRIMCVDLVTSTKTVHRDLLVTLLPILDLSLSRYEPIFPSFGWLCDLITSEKHHQLQVYTTT